MSRICLFLAMLIMCFASVQANTQNIYEFVIIKPDWLNEKLIDTYTLTYKATSPTSLKITKKSSSNPAKTLLEVQDVQATVVDKAYLQSQGYTVPLGGPESGLIFTNNNQPVANIIYYTSKHSDLLQVNYYLNGKKDGFSEDVSKTFGNNSDHIQKDIKNFNALKQAIAQSRSQSASTQSHKSAYTGKIVNPQFIVKTPGADAYTPWMMLFNVEAPGNEQRNCYLFMKNADTKRDYTNSATGANYMFDTPEMNPTSVYVEPSQMPKATRSKPVRLYFLLRIQSPSTKTTVAEYQSPVYLWDGTYLQQE